MTLASLISFSIFALVAAITPGPNNIMLAASGANYGFRRSLPHIIGICVGFSFLVIAAGLGLGSFLHNFPQLFSFLKIMALFFLLYLVWKIGTASSAALFQWINPKGVTVAISAITAYLDAASNIWQALPLIVVIFVLATAISTCVWTFLGAFISEFLANKKQRIVFNITTAFALIISMLPAIISM